MVENIVWFEALTPKQALLFSTVAKNLPKDYTAIFTTRKYDLAADIISLSGYEVFVAGKYGGDTLEEKLKESIYRQKMLLDYILELKDKPIIHVTFVSPDSSRVALGLGIPIIALSDSPHSEIVSRLSIPLANYLLVPHAVKKEFDIFSQLVKLISFRGVFEVAWVNRFKPREDILEEIELKPYNYVIVRTEEKKAYYYPYKTTKPTRLLPLINSIPNNIDVIVYTRYHDQRLYIENNVRRDIRFLEKAIDMQTLEYFSVGVITGGSSMATESALLGTPSICLFPKRLPILSYLIDKGFPLYWVYNINSAIRILKKIIEERTLIPKLKKKILNKVATLEDPVPILINLIGKVRKKKI